MDKTETELEVVYDMAPLADIVSNAVSDDIGSSAIVKAVLGAIPRIEFIESEQ